jgi:hypothetical protein
MWYQGVSGLMSLMVGIWRQGVWNEMPGWVESSAGLIG